MAIFGRADAAYLTEDACEVLLRFEAAGQRHVEHAQLSSSQDFLRSFDSLAQDELVRGLARRLAEHVREMSGAQGHRGGHLLQAQVTVEPGLHQLLHCAEATGVRPPRWMIGGRRRTAAGTG